MAAQGCKLSEVIADQNALMTGPGMYGSGGGTSGKSSPVKGGAGGQGPGFKAPSRSGGGGGGGKGRKSKEHSEK